MKRIRPWIPDAIISAALTILMMLVTKYFPQHGSWYSVPQVYLFQIKSLLHGRFALYPSPWGLFGDAVWSRGTQQLWGLGVPILYAPFEIAAWLVGKPAFPDYVIFVIFYFATLMLAWKFLGAVIDEKNRFNRYVILMTMISWAFFCPQMLRLIYLGLSPYHTPILYGCVLTIAALLIAQSSLEEKSAAKFFVVSFLCGFLTLVKVTYLFHGTAIFLALASFRIKKGFGSKQAAIAAILFLLSPAFLAFANYERFGRPTQFGYGLNINSSLDVQMALRFDYPYGRVPIFTAAKELIGFLFLPSKPTDISQSYEPGHLAWEAPVARWREIYLEQFPTWAFLIFAAAWILPLRDAKWKFARNYSFLSFIMLSAFYLRSPSLSSRYAVDYVPSFVAASWCLLAFVFKAETRFLKNGSTAVVLATAAFAASFQFPQEFRPAEHNRWKRFASDYPFREEMFQNAKKETLLPDRYACNDIYDSRTHARTRSEADFGIYGNFFGWNAVGDCMVANISMMFFDMPECLKIDFTTKKPDPKVPVDLGEIEMKSNLEFMKKTSDTAVGSEHCMTFCRGPDALKTEKDRYQMITIKWLNINYPSSEPNIKLTSVEKVSAR